MKIFSTFSGLEDILNECYAATFYNQSNIQPQHKTQSMIA